MLPAVATLLVPGPEDGGFARFAGRLAASLGRGATTAIILRSTVLGGPDGVTAANRFATEGAPDGRTLLVLPGLAALARMIGDPRARFDAAGWLPVCAAQGSAVVVGRDGDAGRRRGAALRPGRRRTCRAPRRCSAATCSASPPARCWVPGHCGRRRRWARAWWRRCC